MPSVPIPIHPVAGGLQQQLVVICKTCSLPLGLLALRDVPHERAERDAFMRLDRDNGQLDRELCSVLPQGGDLDPLVQHRPFARFQIMGQPAPVGVPERGPG